MITRLLTIFSLFLFWSGGGEKKQKTNESVATQSISNIPPQYVDTNEVRTLRLMFAGDIMSQSQQIESAELGGGEYDYTPCFQYIKPIFDQADLVFGNLECTLPGHPPYTGYPNFRSPDQLAEALKKGGFDVLVTSNNHALDGGLEGVNHTIEIVKKQGLLQTGTFEDALKRKVFYPLILYKNGFKLALLNYTHHTNGIPPVPPAIVNRLSMETIKKDIEEAKKMKPDVIITFLHWGEEHQLDEGSEQRGVAKLLHDWGSDLVVGSHPHVVQPIKNEAFMHNGKQVNYLTAYSLGNFISSQPFPNTEGGIVYEVNLTKTNGRVQIGDYFYIPVLRYTPYQNGEMKFYALPISPIEGHEDVLKMPADEREKMANFAAKMRAHLGKHKAQERLFVWEDIFGKKK
ncbi:MAG: CapA family protein [Saprospiraceae bacterium]|nr:CapA family protein [Saprospiraceae bacterium]